MTNERWYVVHSKPRKEEQVHQFLQSKQIKVFFPTLRVKPINPRAAKIRPYFPRYLFVQANLDEIGQSVLKWLPGALGLVQFDGEPASVPDRVIQVLQGQIDNLEDDLRDPLRGLATGDKVRVLDGAFKGYEAIFDKRLNGEDRAQILLEWLGRQVKIETQAQMIEKVRSKK